MLYAVACYCLVNVCCVLFAERCVLSVACGLLVAV